MGYFQNFNAQKKKLSNKLKSTEMPINLTACYKLYWNNNN